MSLSKNIIRIFSSFLVLSMTAIPASASDHETKIKSVLNFKDVKLVKLSEDINLMMDNGNLVSLPRFDKVLIDKSLSVISKTDVVFENEVSADVLKEKLSLQKEMNQLSKKLGVDVQDASLINLYREAADWLGTRYRRGGMSRKGVDCSGFTNIIYNTVFDKKIERVSFDIANNLKESLSVDKLSPGDLVFFATNRRKSSINHVGVYLGDGHFVHASTKHGVIVSSLNEGFYQKTWRKGGKVE